LAGGAPSSTSNTPVADNSALIGGIVGGVAMAALVVAGVVGFAQMRKRHSRARTVSRSSSVHVVKHVTNPLGNPPDPSFTQHYSTSSMRLPVAFNATKTRSSV
jgi:hypothetical protein